jgi:hypothetical protein
MRPEKKEQHIIATPYTPYRGFPQS